MPDSAASNSVTNPSVYGTRNMEPNRSTAGRF